MDLITELVNRKGFEGALKIVKRIKKQTGKTWYSRNREKSLARSSEYQKSPIGRALSNEAVRRHDHKRYHVRNSRFSLACYYCSKNYFEIFGLPI